MLSKALRRMKHWFMPGTMNALAQLRAENERLFNQIVQWKQLANEAVDQANARVNAVLANAIRQSTAESFFECEFNGVRVLLPRDTLRTMTHCIHPKNQGPLLVLAETFHTEWLKNKLRPGDLFLDVGASTGAMTIPIAKSLPDVRVIAFEPNRHTNRVLQDTLARNDIAGVEVCGLAVSDTVGSLTFVELPHDVTGNAPWQPESSSLITEALRQATGGERYEAPITTLDAFFAGRTDFANVRAVKIDVEGYEVHVLRGSSRLLKEVKPFLAIDIHINYFGSGTTEADCRAVLQGFDYSFGKEGHVLLCYPPA